MYRYVIFLLVLFSAVSSAQQREIPRPSFGCDTPECLRRWGAEVREVRRENKRQLGYDLVSKWTEFLKTLEKASLPEAEKERLAKLVEQISPALEDSSKTSLAGLVDIKPRAKQVIGILAKTRTDHCKTTVCKDIDSLHKLAKEISSSINSIF